MTDVVLLLLLSRLSIKVAFSRVPTRVVSNIASNIQLLFGHAWVCMALVFPFCDFGVVLLVNTVDFSFQKVK